MHNGSISGGGSVNQTDLMHTHMHMPTYTPLGRRGHHRPPAGSRCPCRCRWRRTQSTSAYHHMTCPHLTMVRRVGRATQRTQRGCAVMPTAYMST
jgi:hypothetical protein